MAHSGRDFKEKFNRRKQARLQKQQQGRSLTDWRDEQNNRRESYKKTG